MRKFDLKKNKMRGGIALINTHVKFNKIGLKFCMEKSYLWYHRLRHYTSRRMSYIRHAGYRIRVYRGSIVVTMFTEAV